MHVCLKTFRVSRCPALGSARGGAHARARSARTRRSSGPMTKAVKKRREALAAPQTTSRAHPSRRWALLQGVGFEVCVSTFEMCAPSTSSTRAHHLREVVPLHLIPYCHLHTSHASSSADGYLVGSADDIQLVCESDERRAGARPLHVGLRAPGTARGEKGFHRMQAEEPACFREVLAAWCDSQESPAHARALVSIVHTCGKAVCKGLVLRIQSGGRWRMGAR